MANDFARKWLKGVLENDELTLEEKAGQIIDRHLGEVNEIKEQRDTYKAEADKAADLQKQLEEINSGEDFKTKYEKEHQDFEDFKKKTADEAEASKVRAAYKSLLVDEKIGAKRIDSICKLTDFTKMKLGKDGKLEGEEDLRKTINDEWGEFKTAVSERGAVVEKPPQIGKATKTKEEIFAIKDTAERQKAIAENHELFGF